MRKGLVLIILGVFLVFAPLAKADFEIGVRYTDGTAFDPATDILDIGESLYLSLYVPAGTTVSPQGSSAFYYWDLVCNVSQAQITGGVLGPDAYLGYVGSTYCRITGRGGNFRSDVDEYGVLIGYPEGVYADDFLYSPQSLGSVTIELWGSKGRLSPPSDSFEIIDSLVINQIPEPTTVLLLGLGSLMFRRKREI